MQRQAGMLHSGNEQSAQSRPLLRNEKVSNIQVPMLPQYTGQSGAHTTLIGRTEGTQIIFYIAPSRDILFSPICDVGRYVCRLGSYYCVGGPPYLAIYVHAYIVVVRLCGIHTYCCCSVCQGHFRKLIRYKVCKYRNDDQPNPITERYLIIYPF